MSSAYVQDIFFHTYLRRLGISSTTSRSGKYTFFGIFILQKLSATGSESGDGELEVDAISLG